MLQNAVYCNTTNILITTNIHIKYNILNIVYGNSVTLALGVRMLRNHVLSSLSSLSLVLSLLL